MKLVRYFLICLVYEYLFWQLCWSSGWQGCTLAEAARGWKTNCMCSALARCVQMVKGLPFQKKYNSFLNVFDLIIYSQPKKDTPICLCMIQNRVPLSKITYLKSAGMLFFKYCAKRYGLELSKELLCIVMGQGAAKLWCIKVGVPRKLLCARSFT